MDKASKKIFETRRATIKKKAGELSSLCGADVCVLCFGPDGGLDVWPEDPAKARSVIAKYAAAAKLGSKCKRREKLELSDVLGAKIKTLRRRLDAQRPVSAAAVERIGASDFPLREEQLALLPKESLVAHLRCLESKIHAINGRIESLAAKQHGFFQKESRFSLPSQSPESHEQLFTDSLKFSCLQKPNTDFWPAMDRTVCDFKYEAFGGKEFAGCSLFDKLAWTDQPFCFVPTRFSSEY